MPTIFQIAVESAEPNGRKWKRESLQTSDWKSAEPILDHYAKLHPTKRHRIVAELIDFPLPDEPAETENKT